MTQIEIVSLEQQLICFSKPISFSGIDLSFDGSILTADLGGAVVEWDGLSSLRIIVDKGARTCGLCSNNDGMENRRLNKPFYDIMSIHN